MQNSPTDFFNPAVRAMFNALRTQYLASRGNTAVNITRFDAFYATISQNSFLAARANDAQQTGSLRVIDYLGQPPSQYDSGLLNGRVVRGNFEALQNTNANGSPNITGTLSFSLDAIEAQSFTATFIAAHEIGHAQYAVGSNNAHVAALNTAINFVRQSQYTINRSSDSSNTIDVTAEIQKIVDIRLQEEGRANIIAYNDLASSYLVSGGVITNADRLALLNGTQFGAYLIDPATGGLLPGLALNTAGLIDVTSPNIQAAGNAAKQYQLSNPSSGSHPVVYAAGALAILSSLPSKATLVVDAAALGLVFQNANTGQSQTFAQAVNLVAQYSFLIGSATGVSINQIRDSVTGQTLTIKVDQGQNSTTTSSGAPPDPTNDSPISNALTSALQYNEDRNFDGATGATLPEGVSSRWTKNGWTNVDARGRSVRFAFDDRGRITHSFAQDGLHDLSGSNSPSYGVTVVTKFNESGQAIDTNITLNDNPLYIEFSDAGGILGQQLGYLLAGDNRLAGIAASSALQTIGDNLGDLLDGIVGNQSITKASKDAFATFDSELLTNLKSAGVGALSSYLTAELIGVLGVEGFAGELANTAGGVVINTVLTNIVNGAANPFANIGLASVPTAVASFLGNKLANEVISFDTIGGQLGSAVGSALGVAAGIKLFASLGAIGGPVGALAGAFFGTIAGGLIGSLFGGTPRSGADVVWDEEAGGFTIANIYSRKGGSKDAAASIAATVAGGFNGIIAATGGSLLDPEAVQTGNYGMRKKDFVYRPFSTRDKEAITQRFSGKDGAEKLIGYGLYQGLSDPDFKIAGGDIYMKRALYNTFDMGGVDPQDFDAGLVLGNIATARAEAKSTVYMGA